MDAFPLIVEPRATHNLAKWGEQHCPLLREMLDEAGAILFRGFDVGGPQAFSSFISASTSGALPYTERSSPRRAVLAQDNIYTSTQYSEEHEIFLHNEQSYNLHFPLIIAFCCLQPAAVGGETPIADTRKIYRRLSEKTREQFHQRKYMYLRNYDGKFGLPWNTAFQTTDALELEAYCRANQIEFQWQESGRVLTTRQIREVVARHPRTQERCWFNHATFFHVRSQDAEVVEMMLEMYGDERRLPHSTYYGDAESIPTEVVDELRAAYLAEKVAFSWQKGDVLLLDNMLASHGRSSYRGERTVITAMADPVEWKSVTVPAEEVAKVA
jgi:alpha-ketoglutarate-dependent taurine dioxygenase